MREVSLKEREVQRLKRYPLKDIVSTESEMFYYKKDHDNNSILLKKLFITDEDKVNRKIKTIDTLQRSNLIEYPELVLPDKIVSIKGIKSGFLIREVKESVNFHLFLDNRNISNTEKLQILKKIGELLKKVQSQKQEFYFGDLQDYNFLVDKNKDIYVIDLDSSAVKANEPITIKYTAIDSKTHGIEKYRVCSDGRTYPSVNNDIFCYNSMVLNFIAGTSIHRMDYNSYYDYLDYLKNIGFPDDMIDIYQNHYTNKNNELVSDMLDDIPNEIGRANYNVYKVLRKAK